MSENDLEVCAIASDITDQANMAMNNLLPAKSREKYEHYLGNFILFYGQS